MGTRRRNHGRRVESGLSGREARSHKSAAETIVGYTVLGVIVWSIASMFGWAPSSFFAEQQKSDSAYYPNCAAAREAGVAPINEGEPGYRPKLDRDSDGVACEPYLR